jgi:putative transposase
MLKDMEWFRRNKRKRGQSTGSSQYVDEIEKKIERRVEFRGQGRPRKSEK